MADKILAGYETVGRYEPIQLYAGEKQPVSTQGVLTGGQVVGQLNARNETFKFPLVSEVAGKLVEFDGSAPLKGVLPHALDLTGQPDTDTPIFVEGVFNFDAMDTTMTYAALRAAEQAPGTGITFQALY
jgi:hypothetical protein